MEPETHSDSKTESAHDAPKQLSRPKIGRPLGTAGDVPTPSPREVPASEAPAKSGVRSVRVAILGSRGIPARYGGFETFVEALAPRLVERGLDVTVFCEGKGSLASFRGVKLRHVRAWAPGPLRTLQFDANCLASACRGFDVVYMLGYGSSPFCALPRVFRRRVWINMDGLEWRRSKWNPLARVWLRTCERVAASFASRLVFDNAALRDEVIGRLDVDVPTSVIEYGAPVYARDDEVEALRRFELESGGYSLVVCRAEPENHVLEILRAHATSGVARPLVVVANVEVGGAYVKKLRAALGANARLLGSVYDPKLLAPLRRHAFDYVHGHSVGGTNPSLLEAMGAGNVVLAHDNPFNRETLAGSALFWQDESELVERFRESENLPPKVRARFSERCVARVREHYDWERIADAYAAAFRELHG